MDKDEASRVKGAILSNLYSEKPQPLPTAATVREAAQAFTGRIGESEYSHQRRLHLWLGARGIYHFHPPNELCRTREDGLAQKAIGLSPGVPDLVIPIPRKPYHGLFLELKREGDGVLSGAQEWWIETLRRMGYAAYISYCLEDSIALVESYMALPYW